MEDVTPTTHQASLHSNIPSPTATHTSGRASSSIPTLPQIATQLASAPRPTASSHSYSRSSPAVGMDQKYTPFSSADSTKYPSTPSNKYSTNSSGGPSHSPLALADIRPQGHSHMMDELSSSNAYTNDATNITQTSSSHQAPWPIYAYDWCKWPVSGGAGVGKMAICSYLEDPHNFVCFYSRWCQPNILRSLLDTNP